MAHKLAVEKRTHLMSVGGFGGLTREDELITPVALGIVLCLASGAYRAYLCPDRASVESVITDFQDSLDDQSIRLVRTTVEEMPDFPERDTDEVLIELNGRLAQYLGAMMMLMSNIHDDDAEVS